MRVATLTLKFRLHYTPEQANVLVDTVQQYTASFNRVCQIGWTKQRINGVELHHDTYYAEREVTGLPAQLVCSARVKATEALVCVRTLKKKGKKVSCPVSKFQTIRYDARSALIKLTEGHVSLMTLAGRQVLTFTVPKRYQTYVACKIASSDLRRDWKNRFWLHVVIHIEIPAVQPTGEALGVDLGVSRPAVTSNNHFLGKRRWKEVEARAFRLRRALQAKGTKSAKRHLRRLGRRLNRFRQNCDHVLSRQIVNSVTEGTTIVMEDLTNIRARVKLRKQQRRRLHSWSFHRLRTFIAYKAELGRKFTAFGDPRYTSQKCNRCGHREKANRRTQSEFCCRKCGFRLNADLNASRNIRNNYLASKAICAASGLPVNEPNVGLPASLSAVDVAIRSYL